MWLFKSSKRQQSNNKNKQNADNVKQVVNIDISQIMLQLLNMDRQINKLIIKVDYIYKKVNI